MATNGAAPDHQGGNAYNLFILVLTVVSLLIMVLMWLPFSPETIVLLRAYDNVICVIFLIDFALTLRRARSKRTYFFKERGWLDLLGSIPAIRGAEAVGFLRLARLSRLGRISRLLRGQNRQQILGDVLRNRAQYAGIITAMLALLVIGSASIVVLNAESGSPTANIETGGDALWWAIVTVTTVGYGDRFPTTPVGRTAATFVMIMGVGIIGSLASIMASMLVGSAAPESEAAADDKSSQLDQKLDTLDAALVGARDELAALRRLVERLEEGRSAVVSP